MNSKYPRIISFALIIFVLPLAFHLSLSWILGKRFLDIFNAKGVEVAERLDSLLNTPVSIISLDLPTFSEGEGPYAQIFLPSAFIRIEHGILDEYGLPVETHLKTSPVREGAGVKEMESALKIHSGYLRNLGEREERREVVIFEEGGYIFFAKTLHKEGKYDGSAVVAAKSPPRISAFIFHGAAFVPLLSFLFVLLFAALSAFKKNLPEKREIVAVALSVFAAISILYFKLKSTAAGVEKDFPFFLVFALSSAGIAGATSPRLTRVVAFFLRKPFIFFSIAPAMASVIVLIFIPFSMGVLLAFLDSDMNFAGFTHFKEIIFPDEKSDVNFYFTLGVTVLWTAVNISIHVIIGLFLAILLSDAKLRLRGFYRVILILPWAIPSYITALIWKWMFSFHGGPVNGLLEMIGLGKVDWFGTSFWSNFSANLVTNIWLGFPFMMVVSLGALQSIPTELYEVADIDGASRWHKFTRITLPLLKPALFPAVILGTIWTFNMFNVIYLVSGGAPDNKTNILITEAYRAFRVLRRFGLAAAYSLIIFIILFAYTWVTNRYTKATGGAYE